MAPNINAFVDYLKHKTKGLPSQNIVFEINGTAPGILTEEEIYELAKKFFEARWSPFFRQKETRDSFNLPYFGLSVLSTDSSFFFIVAFEKIELRKSDIVFSLRKEYQEWQKSFLKVRHKPLEFDENLL